MFMVVMVVGGDYGELYIDFKGLLRINIKQLILFVLLFKVNYMVILIVRGWGSIMLLCVLKEEKLLIKY